MERQLVAAPDPESQRVVSKARIFPIEIRYDPLASEPVMCWKDRLDLSGGLK